jgi:hypothetical protein
MDPRTFIAAAVGLVLLAVGGFYFALTPRSYHPPALRQTAPAPAQPARDGAASPQPSAPPQKQAAEPTAQPQPEANPAQATPQATTASIEDELARSDQGPVQALIKKYFPDDYGRLIAEVVEQRNAGLTGDAFDQDVTMRAQNIMRTKLKFAAGASTAMIDQLAANEVNLFHALGTEGAAFCLKVLGKDTTPAQSPLPAGVRRLMQLGTLYRFQAIVEGQSNEKPVEPLTAEEMAAFQASLGQEGMKFEDVRTGAFLTLGGEEPGQACLMVEKLYRAIARLPEVPRRKIYSGMFFLGRDR